MRVLVSRRAVEVGAAVSASTQQQGCRTSKRLSASGKACLPRPTLFFCGSLLLISFFLGYAPCGLGVRMKECKGASVGVELQGCSSSERLSHKFWKKM